MSILTKIDGYKLDHRRQYPKNTTRVYSNFTPRSSRVDRDNGVVFFGLQYYIDKYLCGGTTGDGFENFFRGHVKHIAANYADRVNKYLGPNSIDTDHIYALHRLGYLPLKINAIPEGTYVPLRVPVLTIENTHPDFAWLVNYLETLMSSVLWMPCTSATTARGFRQALDLAAEVTGSPKEFVQWQGHDFSFRGMPGPEAAAMSGAGHLLFFTGTDTIPAIEFVEKYYGNIGTPNYLIGGSVAATEHSVMSAGGKESEEETYARLLDLYPTGIVSIVSDTWDLWNVLTSVLPSLKDKILAREGKLVIRPDSGDPVKIICGDPNSLDVREQLGVVELLWNHFGGTITSTGHKLLDSHVGVIYGDSINYERLTAILNGLANKGFASANMVFGVGSYTYQYVTRDTYGWAMKGTWCEIDGQGYDIWKDPVTDDGIKKSAVGRLAVLPGDFGQPVLINRATPQQEAASMLRTVWENGRYIPGANEGFDRIRERALASIN